MAANLPKHVRAEKQATAWALRQKCWSEARIALHLAVDQSTVSRWLSGIHRRVLRDLDELAKVELVALLGQLSHIADEAMQAWERSKKPRKRARQGQGGGEGDKPTTQTEIIERDGDPAFLAAYHATFDRIVKLLALEDRFRPAPADDDGRGMTLAGALALAESVDASYEVIDVVVDPPPPPQETAP